MRSLNGGFRPWGSDLFLYEREDTHHTQDELTDTLGSTWMLAWLENWDAKIQLSFNGEWIRFPNEMMLYMAPFSVLNWRFGSGKIRWKALVSYRSPDLHFFDKTPGLNGPLLLPRDNVYQLSCEKDLINYVSQCRNQPQTLAINRDFSLSPKDLIGLQIKSAIDCNYKDELRIEELAQQFQMSRVSLFRYFKGFSGFSPTQYRQRLRLFEAMRLMTIGRPVTTAVLESGFPDLSDFRKQFVSTFYTTPRRFIFNSAPIF